MAARAFLGTFELSPAFKRNPRAYRRRDFPLADFRGTNRAEPAPSTAKRVSEDVLNMLGIHFSGLVVEGFATCIQNQDVRNVALIVLLDQLLLLGRALNVQIDDDKVNLGAIFVIKLDSALCLSF